VSRVTISWNALLTKSRYLFIHETGDVIIPVLFKRALIWAILRVRRIQAIPSCSCILMCTLILSSNLRLDDPSYLFPSNNFVKCVHTFCYSYSPCLLLPPPPHFSPLNSATLTHTLLQMLRAKKLQLSGKSCGRSLQLTRLASLPLLSVRSRLETFRPSAATS
jgi:hypothetical protein